MIQTGGETDPICSYFLNQAVKPRAIGGAGPLSDWDVFN